MSLPIVTLYETLQDSLSHKYIFIVIQKKVDDSII